MVKSPPTEIPLLALTSVPVPDKVPLTTIGPVSVAAVLLFTVRMLKVWVFTVWLVPVSVTVDVLVPVVKVVIVILPPTERLCVPGLRVPVPSRSLVTTTSPVSVTPEALLL